MRVRRCIATLTVITGCIAWAQAQEPTPVTLEITSGTAKPIKVSKAVTKEIIRSRDAGGEGWKPIDGLTFTHGRARITVPWSRISSVTISEPSAKDMMQQTVTLELTSGEKETLTLGWATEWIFGETPLGAFMVRVTDTRRIKKIVEQSAAPLPRDPQTGHSEGAR